MKLPVPAVFSAMALAVIVGALIPMTEPNQIGPGSDTVTLISLELPL